MIMSICRTFDPQHSRRAQSEDIYNNRYLSVHMQKIKMNKNPCRLVLHTHVEEYIKNLLYRRYFKIFSQYFNFIIISNMFIYLFCHLATPVLANHIGGLEARSCQTKDYKIGICCFSTKHVSLKGNSKYGLVQNQDNVSEWSDMSTHRLLFQ